jgi:glycosyltransferase involved in cell wall biosynthesis
MTTVLIPHQTGANIYVRELGRGYAASGCNVVYGSENLLEGNLTPDLVHLQWPEEQYRWRGEGTLDSRITRFLGALADLKQRGAKLAWTVHNIAPHDHVEDAADGNVYAQVINAVDLIVHHCEMSARLMTQRYPSARAKPHVVVPHGHYLAYPNAGDAPGARRKLGIPPERFVFLHFGQIRGYKGLDLLLAAFRRVGVPHKHLLLAGEYVEVTGRGMLKDRLVMAYAKRFSGNVSLWPKAVPSDEVQTYFNAANCVVLSHTRGLNSGVAVLGMTFGKLVIGPRIGCIESVLAQGPNLMFEAGNLHQLVAAMEGATGVDPAECQRRNREAAAGWAWDAMARAVLSRLASV